MPPPASCNKGSTSEYKCDKRWYLDKLIGFSLGTVEAMAVESGDDIEEQRAMFEFVHRLKALGRFDETGDEWAAVEFGRRMGIPAGAAKLEYRAKLFEVERAATGEILRLAESLATSDPIRISIDEYLRPLASFAFYATRLLTPQDVVISCHQAALVLCPNECGTSPKHAVMMRKRGSRAIDCLLESRVLRITDGHFHMIEKIARKFVCDKEPEDVAPWTLNGCH